jgi:hypothetical protein
MPATQSDFNFVGPEYVAPNPYQDRQHLVNWFCEVDQNKAAKGSSPSLNPNASGAIGLLGTPGLIPVANSPAQTIPLGGTWPLPSSVTNLPVRGMWELPGGAQAVVVIANTAYLMSVATPASAYTPATFNLTQIGTLATSSGPVCIRDNGAGGTCCIVDGPYGYFYTFAPTGGVVGTFARITDPDFLGASRIAFIDGWWIFNQPAPKPPVSGQTFYVPSSTYSVVFNASNFALIDSATDNLVTLYENKEELWLLGEKHTEIWYDAGGTYFPFQRLVSTMMQVGCAAEHSIARFSTEGQDGLIWLGKTERGENVVVRTVGFSIEVVSTPAISNAIAKYYVVSDAIGYTYQEDGHEFYVLTFPTADDTWVFDGMTQLWHKRLSYDPYAGIWHRHRSNCFLNFQNQRLVGDYQNGCIYQMTRTAYTDAGWPLVAWRRTPHIWDGGARDRLFMSSLQIEFAPGVGNQVSPGHNPEAVLSISRDGGQTFGSEFKKAIGRVGAYLNRCIWRKLSFARDAIIDVKVYSPVCRDVVGATLKRATNG